MRDQLHVHHEAPRPSWPQTMSSSVPRRGSVRVSVCMVVHVRVFVCVAVCVCVRVSVSVCVPVGVCFCVYVCASVCLMSVCICVSAAREGDLA